MEVLSFRDSHIFVRPAIIEEPAAVLANHAFDEHHVGDLACFFPFFFGGEDWSVGAVEDFARIVPIENRHCGAIDELVICGVVDQDDSA